MTNCLLDVRCEKVLNPLRENVVRQIQDMTDGYGCDVYLEASGNPVSVRQGLLACRKAANFVEFSVFKVRPRACLRGDMQGQGRIATSLARVARGTNKVEGF